MNSSYSTHRWYQYGWFYAYLCMRGIFSLLVPALSLSLAGATPELPSTPAGKVLAGYLEALADLMKFSGALMSNKLLKAEMLAEATRDSTGAYGFGF